MRVHSISHILTNSSDETFSFSALGRPQHAIDAAVETLWLEFCLAEENQEALRDWWETGDGCCTGRGPRYFDGKERGDSDPGPYTREKAIAFGAPVQFSIREDGSAEHFTIMNNDTAVDQFCEFVVRRMNVAPFFTGFQNDVCRECMRRNLNTCPPCRF